MPKAFQSLITACILWLRDERMGRELWLLIPAFATRFLIPWPLTDGLFLPPAAQHKVPKATN